jgi:hypothetical protein
MTITSLAISPSYGGGLVRFFPAGQPPPEVTGPNFDLLQAWGLTADPMTGEIPRLLCSGEPSLCELCITPHCTPPPPPPSVPTEPPPPAAPPNVAFDRTLLGFTPIQIEFIGPGLSVGPMFVRAWPGGVPPTTIDPSLLNDCQTWVRGAGSGGNEVLLHFFNVRDPNGTHPLHQKTIAIPVPTLG